ncbi:ATPase family AAA domain-containing protein 2-like [Anthonomus grandis grandis]|uniref:ATPase family AAA domain-containing protein 2-like n=1 Tax=Anthonomus grandis grandis TaxID=2921223 RepID=UPI002166AC57|nr:ATPase family AAA domain-containing protein 2-like [Anthonomus grandis grandis]
MSTLQNQDQNPCPPQKTKRIRTGRDSVDFCKIGGLNNHLKTLREIIIFPLLHGNVFAHFNIKAPRGVLFYGPPGTGKTLVAAALATEINREGVGKVAFFPRKGADVLDKWVGGSEKNLRDLFEKATKSKPSIIFFDELDGLAPVREKQMDQIHSSVVATLLALMDGLDNKPGVIVIGATNRIEALDPALRRPGRFDKELYFPLPGVDARRQILEVHTCTWKHKPNNHLLTALSEATSGFSGADLQYLCSEAILRCMKRLYPCLKGIKIDPEKIKVEECDFLGARLCQVPSTQKNGMKMRKLTSIIKPLLEGQLNKIIKSIQSFWPHFMDENFKYIIGEERYAGRVILMASARQGVDNHIIPALLQNLEYLPSFVYDVNNVFKKDAVLNARLHFPCVVLLSKVDEWWNIIDECEQLRIATALEEIHAGLPILVLATCRRDIPNMLENFFYNNSSILLRVQNPTDEEKKSFLKPLFFDRNLVSLIRVLENCRSGDVDKKDILRPSRRDLPDRKAKKPIINIEKTTGKRKRDYSSPSPNKKPRQRGRGCRKNLVVRCNSANSLYDINKEIKQEKSGDLSLKRCDSASSVDVTKNAPYFARILNKLLSQRKAENWINCGQSPLKTIMFNRKFDKENEVYSCSSLKNNHGDEDIKRIHALWKHASVVTSKDMAVSQLELLYDVISACINIHWNSFELLTKNLEEILKNIEQSNNIEVS